MSSAEVDTYLEGLEEPKRSTLEALRQTILSLIPDAEQGLSYGVPVFRLHGENIAGFSAAKAHLSYLPHSGTVIAKIANDLSAYKTTKGAVQFATDQPLPKKVVRLLIDTRKAELSVPGSGNRRQ